MSRKGSQKINKKIKRSWDTKLFDSVVTVVLVLAGLIAAYPLWFCIIASVSDPISVGSGKVLLWPIGFSLDGYIKVFKDQWVMIGYRNSLIYTVVGTVLNVMVTIMISYSLARKDLFGRTFFNWFIAIPMWFGGGLIPTYLVVKSLHLVNSPLVLLLLGLVSSYNIIIARAFISSLPYELQEAAKIDGCSDFGIFWRIIMPLSKAILAVLALYCAVGHWNGYFNAMIYLNDRNYQTLQVFLRQILILQQSLTQEVVNYDPEYIAEQLRIADLMKYALIIVASVPLLIFYPFVQKFFVKGVMIGSVKG